MLLLLVLAAAVLGLPALTPAAGAVDPLLSQGRPATASSTENAAFPASAAVDGNTGTRWSSAAADPQWLQVDLGATATISQVSLTWEAAFARAFQLQTSADAVGWTTVFSTTTGTGGSQTLPVTGTGRYVRVLGTARATQFGYSLFEFQVFGTMGTAGSCGTADAALNRPATASSTENAGTPASAAVDGNGTTRWSSAFADPQWLQVDLGASATVCQVVLQWEAAFARGFQIQTATAPGGPFTTIFSTTTGTGGTQTLPVTGTGRYVRMNGTARATAFGYSLFEFQVRTTGGTTTPPPTGTEIPLSFGKPATASSAQNDGQCSNCLPAKAMDFDPASRWATSAWTDPGWIAVDLGATAHVTKVVLQWDPAFATAYQIQVSPDGVNWTPIFSTTTGRGFKETLTVDGTGRFVRMFGTARATTFGYSLWEFQVYGTGGSPVAPPAPPPNVSLPATRMVFDDEFNDAAGVTPSTARWTAETGSGQNNELEFYTPNRNASTDGTGNLVIEARRETTAGSACPGGPCQYTSGRINTAGKFSFTYGHVEARIKVSGTQGLWPAFWMLGANFPTVGWPASGEIDVMEHVGRLPNQVFSTLHAPAYNGGNGDGQPFTGTGDFAAAFHTYGMDWDAAHMTFLVDGNPFFTLTKAQVEATRGPWVYDHPFFVILNNAVGGDFPGNPDATTVMPQRMLVDYVRVFQ
ncbi:MAG TPA: discoidin domain-containing protein [Mycobacteriales bacterium]|nr:discoidin domain-containing protein [Mycobacteriales bacterium]